LIACFNSSGVNNTVSISSLSSCYGGYSNFCTSFAKYA
jgi:hypothetical protein